MSDVTITQEDEDFLLDLLSSYDVVGYKHTPGVLPDVPTTGGNKMAKKEKALTTLIEGEFFYDMSGRERKVNAKDIVRVSMLRGLAIGVCKSWATITHKNVAAVLQVAPSGVGRYHALLAIDCMRRGEPDLPCVIVNSTTGDNSWGQGPLGGSDQRRKLYKYWANQ